MKYSQYSKYFDLQKLMRNAQKYLPDFDRNLFLKAFDFAEKFHKGQLRKDGKIPYIAHPVAVASILTELRADEEMLITALLHDVPEDTACTLGNIEQVFGSKVAFLVDGVTKLSQVYYRDEMSAITVDSLKKLFLHSVKDVRVILVKLADRLHNMRTLGAVPREKQKRIAKETMEIYVPIANLLGIRIFKRELENLCFQYLSPNEYEEISLIAEKQKRLKARFVNNSIAKVRTVLRSDEIKFKIKAKEEQIYVFFKRIRSGKDFKNSVNRVEMRIVVENREDCYRCLGLIHSKFKPQSNCFKDYIATPKFDGYQSLHTAVFGIGGVLTEIAICTERMMVEADYGIASTFFFKDRNMAQDKRLAWFNKVAELEKTKKDDEDFMEDLKKDILQDRILIFTPKGDTVDLPVGSTAIDFAYAIHTNIGNRAVKAIVNNHSVPMTSSLKTGDVVSIQTKPGSRPKLYWLSFAKTTYAREKMKQSLRKLSKEKKILRGRALLQKEFDASGLGMNVNGNFKKIHKALQKHLGRTFHCWEELFVAIGEGEVRAIKIVKILNTGEQQKFWSRGKLVDGMKITVKVVSKNRFRLLADIAEIFYKYSVDMKMLNAKVAPGAKISYFKVQIVVDDLEKIMRMFEELEEVEEVQSVQRVYNTSTLVLAGLALCIPSILGLFYLKQREFFQTLEGSAEEVLNPAIYLAAIIILILIAYLNWMGKAYIPRLRSGHPMMLFSKWLPVLLAVVLVGEFLYINFDLTDFGYLAGASLFGVLMGLVYHFKTKT